VTKQNPEDIRMRRGILAPRPYYGSLLKYGIQVLGRGEWGSRTIWVTPLSNAARELLAVEALGSCTHFRYPHLRMEYLISESLASHIIRGEICVLPY